MPICYKWVWPSGRRVDPDTREIRYVGPYVSAFVSEDYERTYFKNSRNLVRAAFVFDTLEAACAWPAVKKHFELWKCEAAWLYDVPNGRIVNVNYGEDEDTYDQWLSLFSQPDQAGVLGPRFTTAIPGTKLTDAFDFIEVIPQSVVVAILGKEPRT